jgi:hypothetical protein
MAKAFKELKLIKVRFIEEIDELIAEYKEAGTSLDDVDFEEELCQTLSDIIDDVKERDWERSF